MMLSLSCCNLMNANRCLRQQSGITSGMRTPPSTPQSAIAGLRGAVLGAPDRTGLLFGTNTLGVIVCVTNGSIDSYPSLSSTGNPVKTCMIWSVAFVNSIFVQVVILTPFSLNRNAFAAWASICAWRCSAHVDRHRSYASLTCSALVCGISRIWWDS